MIELINRIMELLNQIFGVMLSVLAGVCGLILCVVILHCRSVGSSYSLLSTPPKIAQRIAKTQSGGIRTERILTHKISRRLFLRR